MTVTAEGPIVAGYAASQTAAVSAKTSSGLQDIALIITATVSVIFVIGATAIIILKKTKA